MPHEFNGEKYTKASAHQKEWGARLIAEFELRGDEQILDLGCGDGTLTAKMADLVPDGRVLGIDASRGMIEAAGKHNRPNLTFVLMDINDMRFEAEFDLVFSNATLHWVKDHHRLLANVFEALTDNGMLRFNFGADGNCLHFFKVIREAMAQKEYARYFNGFDWPWTMPRVDEYAALLKQFPFRRARAWGENADRNFPDAEALVGWIDQPSIVPFLKCVDESDKQRFRDTVVEAMVAQTIQNDGTYFETFRRINVLAVK